MFTKFLNIFLDHFIFILLLLVWVIVLISKLKPNSNLLKKIRNYGKNHIFQIFGVILLVVLFEFCRISQNIIWISPIVIYAAICFFTKSELNTKIKNDNVKMLQYVVFSFFSILFIILALAFCTEYTLTHYNVILNIPILITYIIVYIYELILVILCLNPKEIKNLASQKGYNISKPKDFKKFQIFLIIISCIPPFILLTI